MKVVVVIMVKINGTYQPVRYINATTLTARAVGTFWVVWAMDKYRTDDVYWDTAD